MCNPQTILFLLQFLNSTTFPTSSVSSEASAKTTSPSFVKYATMFYEAQREVYGNISNYYATDPFHEGGNIGDMSARQIAKEVLQTMLANDTNSVWVIQAWEGNPSSELLEGIADIEDGKEHALILDLYAEKLPHYNDGGSKNYSYGYKR